MARIPWRFEDAVEGTVEYMEVNPNAGASPAYTKNLTKKTTTAGNRTLVMEGQDSPIQFDFSGVILTQAQYEFLHSAWQKRHPVKITDDLFRDWVVYFETFSPTRKPTSPQYPWRHDYQCTTVVVG